MRNRFVQKSGGLFVAFLLGAAFWMPAGATDRYVVATGGTDSGEGGSDAPWATVTYAVANAVAGDVIHVGAGTWTWSGKVEKGFTIQGEGDTTILKTTAAVTFNAADLVVTGCQLTKNAGANWCAYTLTSGTITNCLITGCGPSSSTVLTALSVTGGLLVDCRITNNSASNGTAGQGASTQASGSATIRNCLFTGNKFSMNVDSPTSYGAGALYVCPANGATVTIENTTVTGNNGGCSGGVQIGTPSSALAGSVILRGCVFAGNSSPFDYTVRGVDANCSKDLYINVGKTGSVAIENSRFTTAPTSLATVATLTDVTYGPAGFKDEVAGDYTLNTGSPAYTHGYHAATRAAGFSCAVKTPSADRAIATISATLEAETFNAPAGTATYEWDFDGDGTYDETTSVPTVAHTFTTVGWNKVGLRVTVGGDVATAAPESVVYVAPSVIYVYPKKNTTGYNIFPYDTPYNAATTLAAAQKAAVAGSHIHVGGGVSGDASLSAVEVSGDGMTSGSAVAGILYLYDKAFVHGLKIYGQRGTGIKMNTDTACISNCWVTGMYYTTGSDPAGSISAGLITHTLYTGNYNNNSGGTVLSLGGTAKMRNCVFTGNYIGSNFRGPLNGIMTVAGTATMENCVVYGNTCAASKSGDAYAESCRPRLGGGIYIPSGSPTIRNCVIRNNKTAPTPSDGKYPTETDEDIYSPTKEADFYIVSGATPTIECCNVPEGQVPACATNSQTSDPEFKDPDNATAANRDFTITNDTSCVVDAGATIDFATPVKGSDYYGNNRVQGYAVDVGVHEVTKPTPAVSVTSSATTYYDEQDVVFTAANTNSAAPFSGTVEWTWTVNGEVQSETGASLTLHVAPIATYAVEATARTYFSDSKTIQVKHSPGIEFTATVAAQKAGHWLVDFTTEPLGGAEFVAEASFKWYRRLHGGDWEQTPFATVQDPKGQRFDVGTWDVKVVVENWDGEGHSLERLHEEVGTVPPCSVAVTLSTPTEGEQVLDVTMTATATGFEFDAGAVYSWQWTNESAQAVNLSGNPANHTFTKGSWSLRLEITNADGDGTAFTNVLENAVTVAEGADWYVSSTGDDSATGTAVAPFRSIDYALSRAADGEEIRLMAGTHTLTNALALSRNVQVVGAGAGKTTVVVSEGKAISVSHADAVFANCTVNKAVSSNYAALTLSAGTVRGCDLTKCSPSTTVAGCVLTMSGGLFEDCRVFGNSVTVGSSLSEVTGDSTVRNCAFYNNTGSIAYSSLTSDNSGAAGLRAYPAAGKTVRIENCTIAGNVSGWTGGLLLSSHINDNYPNNLGQDVAGTVIVTDTVICGNCTAMDVGAVTSGKCSDDIGVYAAAGHVSFSNCHFGVKPTGLDDVVTFTDCTDGYDLAFADETNGDFALTTGSPRYGIGYHAGTRAPGFTAAVRPVRVNGEPVTVTLTALTFNAPEGTPAYHWDFDGDGEYETETSVPTVSHTFTAAGNNKVGLKVVVKGEGEGEGVAVAPDETVVYVMPTAYVKSTGSNTYPYDTEAKAATSLENALTAARKNTRVFVKGSVAVSGATLHDVEVCGDSRASSTLNGSGAGVRITLAKNAFLHDVAYYYSRNCPCYVMSEPTAVASNVWFRFLYYTTKGTPSGSITAGLITHSLYTEGNCNNGPVVSFSGTAKVRNCVFTGLSIGRISRDNNDGPSVGIVGLEGTATLENCVIYGNSCGGNTSNPGISEPQGGACIDHKSGGITVTGGSPTIRNNIVRNNWINTASTTEKRECNYYCYDGATPTVEYNDSTEGFGDHALTADPGFTDPDNATLANRDFTITSDASCVVDAGARVDWATFGTATDYYLNDRVQGLGIDVGVHEVTKATPVVTMTTSKDVYKGDTEVTFTLANSNPSATLPTTGWTWTLNGELCEATGLTLVTNLAAGATYTATATNCFYTVAAKTVEVQHLPGVDFTATPTAMKAGHWKINLSAVELGGITFDENAEYKWYRGIHGEAMGATPFATGRNVTDVRFEVGTWDIKVVVENYDGEGGSIEKLKEEVGTIDPASVDVTLSTPTEGEQKLTVTMTATPTGFVFDDDAVYSWHCTNALGHAVDLSVNPSTHTFTQGVWSVVFTVENADGDGTCFTNVLENAITVAKGANWYVGPSGDDTAAGSHEAPFKNLSAALAVAQSGEEIRIMEGTNYVTSQLTIPAGVTIRGVGREKSILDGNLGNYSGPRLTNAGATLADLTIRRFRVNNANYQSGGGVYMTADCVVTNCRITANHPSKGGAKGAGIYLSAGLVVNSVIDNNTLDGYTFTTGEPNNGAGIRMTGGWVEGCLITNNVTPFASNMTNPTGQTNPAYGGGVSLEGGTLVNCTIVGNSTCGFGGNVYRTKGTIYNCMIAGGVAEYGDSGFADDLYPASATNNVFNSVIGGGETDHIYSFGSAGLAADRTLTDNSSGVGTGDATLAFRATVDLNGNPRIRSGRVDLGCYARTASAASVAISADRRMAKVGSTVTLKAEVHDAAADATAFAWTVTKPSSAVVNLEGATPALTLDEEGTYGVTVTATVGGEPVAGTRNGWLVAAPAALSVTTDGDIHAALDQLTDGCTLNLSGTISVTKPISLKHGVTVQGEGRDATTVQNTKASGGCWRVFDINHPDAVVKGVKITGGYLNAWYPTGAGARIGHFGGRITECLITGNDAGGSSYGSGGGVTMYGAAARLDHTIVSNNFAKADAAAGVLLRGGTIDNCLIAKNSVKYSTINGANSGGIYLASTTAKILNSTIVGNVIPSPYTATAAGLYFATQPAAGQIVNTVIAENTANAAGTTYGGTDWQLNTTSAAWFQSATNCFVNCGFENVGAIGSGSITTATSPFADSANGDYSITTSSALANEGRNSKDLIGVKDIAGAARVQGLRVDIGAFEATEETPVLAVTSSADLYYDEQDVVFTAASSNPNAAFPAETVFTWTVNGEVQAETSASLTVHVAPKANYTVAAEALDYFTGEKTIQVIHTPGVDFTATPTAQQAGHWKISLAAFEVGDVTFDENAEYKWYRCLHGEEMGATPFATGRNVTDARFEVGTWDIKVVVEKADGASQTYEKLKEEVGTIEPASVAVTLSTPTEGEQTLDVTLTATATGFAFDSAAVFSWHCTNELAEVADFAGNPAEHTFTKGTWSVRLEVTNADGDGTCFTNILENAITVTRGADWYVSPSGDDTAAGTRAHPYASVEKAVSVASAGQEIRLMAGTHVLTNALALTDGVKVIGAGVGETTVQVDVGKAISVAHAEAVFGGCTVTKVVDNYTAVTLSAGTVTNCDLKACSPRNTVAGCTLTMTGGLFVDCRVYGIDATGCSGSCGISGDSTIRNCAFYGNRASLGTDVTTSGTSGLHVYPGAGTTVRIENCTITDSFAGRAGGLLISGFTPSNWPGNLGQNIGGTVIVKDSVFCGNATSADVDTLTAGKCSDDIGVYAPAGKVTFENCHFGVKPSGLDGTVTFTDCTDGYDLAFADEANGDYSLPTSSPRYGIGYHAGTRGSGFAASVRAATVRANKAPLATTLTALTFNAPAGTPTYHWDFDGDGVYETTTTEPTIAHTFTAVGNNKVGLKVTVKGEGEGEGVAVAPEETVVYILPTVYLKASGSNTYPYDTEAKAATSLDTALFWAKKNARLYFKGTVSTTGGTWYLHDFELFGDGAASSAFAGNGNGAWTLYCCKNTLIHSLTLSGSRNSGGALRLTADTSVLSNAVVSGMWFSTGGNPGGSFSKGLVTHTKFTGCHCNYGPDFVIGGTATFRNCLFTGNYIDNGTAYARTGIIGLSGTATFENNTVARNYSKKTDNTEAHSAGLYVSGGTPTIRNNIVRDNWIHGAPGASTAVECNYICLDAATPEATHNNSTEGFGESATTGDPLFTDASGGDFTIAAAGAATDKGCSYAAIRAAGMTDYAGASRIQGWAIDQGAFEATQETPTLDFTADITTGVGTQEVTLTLTSDLAIPSGTAITWFMDGAELPTQGTPVEVEVVPGHHSFAVDVNGFFSIAKENYVNIDPETVYVIAGNAGAAYPYNTRAAAAATLAQAVGAAASEGTTIYVAEGEHEIAADLTVAKNVTIVGEGTGSKVTGAGALTLNAGLVERLDFVERAGTLTIGSGATARNILVREATAATAVEVLAGGRLENATLWGNTGVALANAGTAVNVLGYSNGTDSSGAGTFTTCLFGTDPKFTGDPEEGDFSFVFDSPCYNTGTDLEWALEEGAIDFYGEKRKHGERVDIGAYEAVNYTESVDFETDETQMNGYKHVEFVAKARGFHFADTAEFQWFWTTAGTGTPDATGNNVEHDFDTGSYDVYLKVLHADDNDTTFVTNHLGAVVVGPTAVSFSLSATMGGGAKTIVLTASPSGFEFTDESVFKWFWNGTDAPDATENPAVHTFTPGTYGVKLVVENANGHGLKFTNTLANAITIYDNTPPEIETSASGTPLYYDQILAKKFKTVNGQALTGRGTLDIVNTSTYKAVEDVSVYGATGDGVTDDTVAIMAAYDAAVASGKPIYFPKRGSNATYLTRKGIVMRSGMTLTSDPGVTLASASAVLEGGGRTIRTYLAEAMPQGQTYCVVKSTAGLVVGQEVTIGDGNSYQETLADITAIDTETGRIDFDVSRFVASGTNIGARGATKAGSYFLTDFSLVKTCEYIPCSNCLVENITLKPYGNPSDPYIYTISPINQTHQFVAQRYFRIRNVTIDGATHDGISLQGNGDSYVENCVVKDVKRKGIHWGTSCDRVICRNNLCINCGKESDDASTSNWGVGAMYFCVNNHQMIIEGNHFKNCYRGVFGFDYRGSGESDGDSCVANNTFEDCTYGVWTYGGHRLSVTGNTFTGLKGAASAIIINRDSSVGLLSSVLSGNVIGGMDDGWTGTAISIDTCTGLVCEGNVVGKNPNASGKAGIKMKNATNSLFADNVVPDGVDDTDESNTGIVKSGNVTSE